MKQRWRRRIQPFIRNAIKTALPDCAHFSPRPATNNLFQGNTIARSTPGGNQHIWICRSNGFSLDLLAGIADELPSCSGNQLRDPGLRCDQRFAPLFAEDGSALQQAKRMQDYCCTRLKADYPACAVRGHIWDRTRPGAQYWLRLIQV